MWSLLKKDETVEGGWRPKKNLKAPIIAEGANGEEHPGHYRYMFNVHIAYEQPN